VWRCLFECHAAHDKDCVNDSRPQNCERNAPRICWHTIFTCGNSERYGKPLKQRGFLPRSGGHSSSYWYQQGQVPRLGRRVDFPAARVVAALRAHDRACSDGRAPNDPPEIALKLVPFIVPKKATRQCDRRPLRRFSHLCSTLGSILRFVFALLGIRRALHPPLRSHTHRHGHRRVVSSEARIISSICW